MHRLFVLLVLFFSLPARAVTIDWVPIGNPGNAPDTLTNCLAAGCGSVSYGYFIGEYEVTNAQYAEMLNAKAASDPLGLYDSQMGTDAIAGGITQSGVSGSYSYSVKAGFENKPVTYVSFYDALRFANWLNNGQGSADTETGAYTLFGGTPTPSNGPSVTANRDAKIFLPSENEWYKAAYYSPAGVYFTYATGTNSVIGCVEPSADTGNSANCDHVVDAPTNVGAYALSRSPYGTYDQDGNAFEWTEQIDVASSRSIRGGSWVIGYGYLAAFQFYHANPANAASYIGFRVASLVPEPDAGWLGMSAVLGLALRRMRTAKAV
jgi:sulfatase modifying factor 1